MLCFRATKWRNYEINFKRRSSAHSLRRGEGGHRRRFDGNGRVHRLDVILEGNGEFEGGSNSVLVAFHPGTMKEGTANWGIKWLPGGSVISDPTAGVTTVLIFGHFCIRGVNS